MPIACLGSPNCIFKTCDLSIWVLWRLFNSWKFMQLKHTNLRSKNWNKFSPRSIQEFKKYLGKKYTTFVILPLPSQVFRFLLHVFVFSIFTHPISHNLVLSLTFFNSCNARVSTPPGSHFLSKKGRNTCPHVLYLLLMYSLTHCSPFRHWLPIFKFFSSPNRHRSLGYHSVSANWVPSPLSWRKLASLGKLLIYHLFFRSKNAMVARPTPPYQPKDTQGFVPF